jgi:hypothetical protein
MLRGQVQECAESNPPHPGIFRCCIEHVPGYTRFPDHSCPFPESAASIFQFRGNRSAAHNPESAILKIDPSNLTAATNLGVLVAKAGDLQGAAALWQSVFRNNEDIVGLGTNPATAQCMVGEKEHAEETLKLVLTYSPDLRDIGSRLASIEVDQQHCPLP